MRNEFIRNLVPGLFLFVCLFVCFVFVFFYCFLFFLKFSKYHNQILHKNVSRGYYNFDMSNVTIDHYYLFNILKFSSNKKLEKEKFNKKSSLFKKFLELHLLLGFLWETRVKKLNLQFKLLALICRFPFLLRFSKNLKDPISR